MIHNDTERARTRDAFILQEACLFLGLARLMTIAMKFSWFARILGKQGQHEPKAPSEASLERIRKVASAIAVMSRRTPWKTRCLVQSIASQMMLGRRKIDSTLYLGVTRTESKRLKAHAWVKCGDVFVTGKQPAAGFTVVATFSNEFRSPGRIGEEDAG